jgi:S-adenosylmethionine synthetase
MSNRFIFSSESVGEGHPDKVADTISDAVLDACLAVDKFSRVACETYVKSNVAIVGGEITIPKIGFSNPTDVIDVVGIARKAIREIGYENDDDVFHADKVFVNVILTGQSPDIAQGVDARKAKGKKHNKQGAGDQGLMFGYACNETPELMPAPIMFAHRLGRELTRIRKSGKVPWLRPDAKSQVSVVYEDNKPVSISNVVISTQHAADVEHAEIEKFCIENVVKKVLPKNMLNGKTEYLINPTGPPPTTTTSNSPWTGVLRLGSTIVAGFSMEAPPDRAVKAEVPVPRQPRSTARARRRTACTHSRHTFFPFAVSRR